MNADRMVTVDGRRRTLSNAMDFDHPIRVHADGSVSDAVDVYAPELTGEEVPSGWELLNGYSGQYGYAGPIMHASEFIGGGMADDILSTPGVYVALVSEAECNDDCEGDHDPAGWAVARLVEGGE